MSQYHISAIITELPFKKKKAKLYMYILVQLQAETRNKVFAEKLETLLHRAYHLQEDFGSSIPSESVLADFGKSL